MLLLALACAKSLTPQPQDTPAVVETQEPEPVDLCAFEPIQAVGEVQNAEMNEVSGLVASRNDPGHLWAHNDSGDSPRVFKITESGESVGELALDISVATDWEDMAIGVHGEQTVLVLGDIGDNRAKRESVSLHWFAEPAPDAVGPVAVSSLELQYPEGARDAEVLLVDPTNGDLIIVAKDAESNIYRLAAPWTGGTLERVGGLDFGADGLPGGNRFTGGDAYGSRVILRTYTHLFVFQIPEGGSVVEALAGPACEVPVPLEMQGEAVALGEDRYWTVSEGLQPMVNRAVAE